MSGEPMDFDFFSEGDDKTPPCGNPNCCGPTIYFEPNERQVESVREQLQRMDRREALQLAIQFNEGRSADVATLLEHTEHIERYLRGNDDTDTPNE